MGSEKTAFVIAPIGDALSEVRQRSDQILEYVIGPACKEADYEVVRADKISKPGLITAQIVSHLIDDPFVIADLTGHNANVFYELAVRHAVKKPVIQIIQDGETIPFDLANMRTISLDHRDLGSADHCRRQIIEQIRELESNPNMSTPLSEVTDLESLSHNKSPVANEYIQILSRLQELAAMLREFREQEPHLLGLELEGSLKLIKREGELLASAFPKIASTFREFNLQYSRLTDPPKTWESAQKGWGYNQKFAILKNICEVLKQDQKGYEGPSDYFKATLFAVKTPEQLNLDCNYYPPGVQPKTRSIRRANHPGATAFRCFDEGTMQFVPNVREETQKGSSASWVELYPGQAAKYGSMVCAPITTGDIAVRTTRVISVLTIDTNRVNYFSDQDKDKNFLATLLAPFRQQLSFIYLATANEKEGQRRRS